MTHITYILRIEAQLTINKQIRHTHFIHIYIVNEHILLTHIFVHILNQMQTHIHNLHTYCTHSNVAHKHIVNTWTLCALRDCTSEMFLIETKKSVS